MNINNLNRLLEDLLSTNSGKNPGAYDVTCPWIEEHTDGMNNGAAIFTTEDLTLGFKCHHGPCQNRTAKDLLVWCEDGGNLTT